MSSALSEWRTGPGTRDFGHTRSYHELTRPEIAMAGHIERGLSGAAQAGEPDESLIVSEMEGLEHASGELMTLLDRVVDEKYA